MAKGIFARLFGGIGKNNNKQRQEQPIKRARIESTRAPTPPPKSQLPQQQRQRQPASNVIIPTKPQQPITYNEDNSDYLFSDIKDKLTDMNSFINTQGNNDIGLHLRNLNNLKDRVSYTEAITNDEFSTLSSSTSSSLSLQDALFSHFSNTDTQSEISIYSNDYKIIVESQQQESSSSSHYDSNESLFDRRFSVSDTNSTRSLTFHTLPNSTNVLVSQKNEMLYFEKQFSDMYIDGLRLLSKNTPEHSPAHALTLFQHIANNGHQNYRNLNDRTKLLVSFAQYRAGRMLCECVFDYDKESSSPYHSSDDDKNKKHGLLYLDESSKNGNARASFILGFYAERQGDIDQACQFYYQAAMLGLLPAKVAFGNLILFSPNGVSGFKTRDAINMLENAATMGHSVASLSLALYYEKVGRLSLAIKYCQKVQISQSSPIYCISCYQMSVIYLKAGPNFAATAFRYMGAAAKATFYENGQRGSRFTTPLRQLGVLSLMGIGTPRNPVEAYSFIQEAAEMGDIPARVILGQMYWMGLGVSPNLSEAMNIFASLPDNIAAKLSRGLLIRKENPSHAYLEFQRVIHHHCTAFDEEHWNVAAIKNEARVRVAVWEYNGIGGAQKNPKRAFYTLKKLADEFQYSGAYYWIAWAYMDGVRLEDGTEFVPIDKNQAFAYFLKGADENKADCQYYVGKMLREGHQHTGLGRENAFKFFSDAAEKDYAPALTMVGVYYFTNGPGTGGRDHEKAFFYFSAAARHNESLAIQYLADYIIKNIHNNSIDHYHIYSQLNRSAGLEKDPIAYRMLALVVNSGIDPRGTYEKNSQLNHVVYDDLLHIYKEARSEATASNTDVKFRFTLHCLWRAIKLNDHQSGHYLCDFISKMNDDDISHSIDIFENAEGPIANKMTFALGLFLKAAKNKSGALKKFIAVAKANDVTKKTGWSARLEGAQLILNEGQGKARSKLIVFDWLSEMINYNAKNLSIPFILLGKCHENEICNGCTISSATAMYENGLKYEASDKSLEIYARMRLVEIYYKSHKYADVTSQLIKVEKLFESITSVSEKNSTEAESKYYKGLLALRDGTVEGYRKTARRYLTRSSELGNILATLELGYLYGTMEGKEDLAEECFQKVDASSSTSITFKNRLTEFYVQERVQKIKTNNDYLNEINKMKLAAGITYSYYNMERQALDWFHEISDASPVARIMILYYDMKDTQLRTKQNIDQLSSLIDPFEKVVPCDYYDSMAISYAQFRLGQCYEHGHGVQIDINLASDFYNKACVFLLNNETYERLAEITKLMGSDTKTFPTFLLKAARNDTNATFKLGQYYHSEHNNGQDVDTPCKKAADYYHKSAQVGHAESCYYYAKYLIAETIKDNNMNAAARSKRAVNYLRTAANKNHAPSYYELGKLEIKAGLYEEGFEDLEEAACLNHGLAAYELGELYRNGFTGIISGEITFKISKSASEAKFWYKRATENGCMLSLIREGSFYETGELGNQNLVEARKCYMKAYESRKCPEGMAEYALGCLEETYLSVSGVFPTNRHRNKAFDWFYKSLQANNQNANFKIGSYLVNGWVIQTNAKNDELKGLEILIQEKSEGNVSAMKELAYYYEKKGNLEKAFEYWAMAGRSDDPEALEFLAKCFRQGLLGQTIDHEQSSRFESLAKEARKQAIETQRSIMGFKSDYSEERNHRSK
ncbi:hypothetical protein INT47_003895 [Mucor saturninus]|uniref:HCP-like protein n=1 Tax=Mucor saturninus TaxID=64648 RepID=A0A8H7V523_9FUNG|nr:hypothetical protein INT47_003895 [Mucor saturninus]